MKKWSAPALGTAAALSLALLTGCAADPGGKPSERAVVDAYVSALNAGDAKALAGLVVPGNMADREIATRLKAHGGQDLTVNLAEVISEFGPDHAFVDLWAKGRDGKEYRERLTVAKDGADGWYLAIGSNSKGRSKPTSR